MIVRPASFSRLLASVLIGSAVLSLSACGSLSGLKDIPEILDSEFDGAAPKEFITQADLAKVQVGMSQVAVRNRLGQPLVGDKNEKDRYDYVLRTVKGNQTEYTPYGVYFENGAVTKVVALEKDASAPIADAAPAAAATAAPAAQAPAVDLAPEPVAQAPAAAPAGGGEVEDVVKGWAAAWANQDVNAYMGFYSSSFQPASGSRKSWERQRKDRLSSPSRIELTISDITVTPVSDKLAQVSFKQGYASNTTKENGKKTLIMSKEDGGWKITRETFKKG